MKPQPLDSFQSNLNERFHFLPFRFTRIPGIKNTVLMVSETGEYIFLSEDEFSTFIKHDTEPNSELYRDLKNRNFLYGEQYELLELSAAQIRTKKSFLKGGPSLHIFVVSLRCDHSCLYCQVSRQSPSKSEFDMTNEVSLACVDRLFESPAQELTVEFQGGEPLLAFNKIKFITETILKRNETQKKKITFTLSSTLHFIDDDMLSFFKEHHFHLSTSLDGPEWLHNANRKNPGGDSYGKTIEGIERVRESLCFDSVSALTTLTKKSLEHPEAIIDEYVKHGFNSIFLRPLSPYGFAYKSENAIGYLDNEFLEFYKRAIAYLIELNLNGIFLEETFTKLLLNNILTPFPNFYTDLRSPTGAGLGCLVYNYDGKIYASDESRMLAEMGDYTFCLGNAFNTYEELLESEGFKIINAGGVAESLPGCSDCAYLPYCGADPVYNYATQHDPIGYRPQNGFCKKQTGIFEIIFTYLHEADPEIMKVFLSWITGKQSHSFVESSYSG